MVATSYGATVLDISVLLFTVIVGTSLLSCPVCMQVEQQGSNNQTRSLLQLYARYLQYMLCTYDWLCALYVRAIPVIFDENCLFYNLQIDPPPSILPP
jgi:hypothetical protein